MNTKKEKLLNDTYEKWMQAGLYDLPLDKINEFIDPKIMGYGTAIDEKVLSISEYKQLINRQREQAVGIEMDVEITPVFRSLTNQEDAAIFVDEIKVKMIIGTEKLKIFLRITTLFEYIDSKWIVIHWHGSIPTDTKTEDDAWLVNEWKRKNAELEKLVAEKTEDLLIKNKELEIESALEKVRSSALSMKQPGDMVDVCRIISDQLELLGVNDIRNVQTAIINEQKVTYLNYQYFAAYKEGVIEETNFNKHPTVFAMVEEMKKSANSTFSGIMKGKELVSFREWRKQNHQFPDPILDGVDTAHYYFYSIGLGGLGLTTYKQLNSDGLEIFRRFHNVFSLAYRRFIDIEKAEAQAREAKIEAALERVRSRSMGMQKSEELKEVIQVVYEQFVHLKIKVDHAGFVVDYTPRGDWNFWIADEQDIPSKITHPYFESVWANQFNEAKEKGADLFATNLNFEEKNKFYNELLSYVPGLPEASRDFYLSCPGLAISTVLFDNVSLYIENFFGTPYSEEENKILIRFGKVFQQTYTRFLDLQKAEAQAREAQIEAALERVRSRTMTMQQSTELGDVSAELFSQMNQIVTNLWTCGFVLCEKKRAEDEWWLSMDTGFTRGFFLPNVGDFTHATLYEGWLRGESFRSVQLEGTDLQEHYDWLMGIPVARNIFEEMDAAGLERPDWQKLHAAYFSRGYLVLITREPCSEEEIFKRFAQVFDLIYTRFLDLQRAEAQNKIIQAENERKTKELEDARQLQLSMLPRELPKVSNLDISVYMKTATEVGGDYYDFHIQPDGSLNVLVGDATGHGMMSGMMVSIMKSFFIANRYKIELKEFFENSNISIKDMQLGRLMIACIGVQITSQKVIATNAGMPSLLYFRNKSQRAGEFVINNMPLGAMRGSKYALKEINYEKGDTLLLMSDGFAELKNKNNEQYGYPRIIEEFKNVVQKSSDDIVEHLKNSSSEWANGVEPDDDITFVVIKVI